MTNAAEASSNEVQYVNVDVETGIIVQSLMFRHRIKQDELGRILGLSGASVSRKLRGLVAFSLVELYKIGRALEVDPADLLPRLDSNQQPCGYPSSQVSAGAMAAWSVSFDNYAGGELLESLTPGERWRDWCLGGMGSSSFGPGVSRVLGYLEVQRLVDGLGPGVAGVPAGNR